MAKKPRTPTPDKNESGAAPPDKDDATNEQATGAPPAEAQAESEAAHQTGDEQKQAEPAKPVEVGFGAAPKGVATIEAITKKDEETVLMVFTEEVRITDGGRQIVVTTGVHKVPKRLANHWYFKAAGARPA